MAPSKKRSTSEVPFAPLQKVIRLRAQDNKAAEGIAREFSLHPVAARVIAARGHHVKDDLRTYLEPTLKDGLPPPQKLFNLDRGVALTVEAVKCGQAIAVCCDFDVDGLSGGAQLVHFFSAMGVRTRVFVPDRFADGYGLNSGMVKQAAEEGFKLLITVDYGTTSTKELELARTLGLKTIVIDHHHVGDHCPPCDVFINPQQKDCGFAGGVLSASGLAWYFLVGVRKALEAEHARGIDPRTYLDLTCLGTICDMVPLVGANRVIARRGLELLSTTQRAGLVALKQVVGAKREVSCYDVSFGIGPRLNAAGRMVHGEVVIDLLTTTDQAKAARLAHQLNRLNLERQDTETEVKEAAIEQLYGRYSGRHLPSALVVWDESFHTGVIGIVAQRLVEMFYRPSIVMGLDTDGIFKGSVRGIKGLSVVDTLAATSGHLIKFGGHDGAGGFSVEAEKVEEFSEAFQAECAKRIEKLEAFPCAEADTEATLEEIDKDLVTQLRRFSPFGMGNPNPQLLVRKLTVVDVKELKSAHLKATLTDGRRTLPGMFWRQKSHPALTRGAKVNIVARPDISTYNGLEELQLTLQAVEAAG